MCSASIQLSYGLLASAFAAGLLVGALGVGAIGWRLPLGRSIAAGVFLTGASSAAITPAFPELP